MRTAETSKVVTKADLTGLETRLTSRIIIVGLTLNSICAAAVIAAVGWMLS